MSTELIREKFTNHFTKNEYQFLTPGLEPKDLKWPTPEQIKQIIYHQNTAYPEIRGLGKLFGLASASPAPISILEKFLTSLLAMQTHGEIVGFSLGKGLLKNGAPTILLAVDSEKLNDEQIIGRFILIREAAQEFRNYALTPYGGARWSKHPTNCHIFMIFKSHSKALYFSEHLEGKCKHYNVFTKAPHVFPWTVDLERKRVKKYSGLPLVAYHGSHFNEDVLENAFFD